MRAAIFEGLNKIEVRDIEIPKISESEVLVKVKVAGVCVTDYNNLCGNVKMTSFPHVMGHEICGVVVKTGSSARHIKVGTRCVISTMVGCGHCEHCRRGYQYLCKESAEIGFSPYNGGYSEFVKVPSSCIVAIPDEISDEEGGILESIVCPFESMIRVGVKIGGSVLIQGLGYAGLVATMLASKLGATKIIVTARRNDRESLAKELGATDFINLTDTVDVVDAVKKLTDGEGVDLAIDAVGVKQVTQNTIFSTRKGGDVLLYGLPKKDDVPSLPSLYMIANGISIHGGAGNTNTWQQSIEFIKSKKIDIKRLITNRFDLEHIEQAFELYRNNDKNNLKSIIVFNN